MKKLSILAATLSFSASAAYAHHPLNGMPMETFTHGLLSGVGHPVLGFDHLFFVIAVGIAALVARVANAGPAAYIGSMLIGCLLSSFGTALPLAEVVIAASLLVVGGVLALGRPVNAAFLMALFAIFGLFHGSAFGDSIASQEATIGGAVMLGYLIGLGLVQYLIAVISVRLLLLVYGTLEEAAVQTRIAGAIVAGMGAFLTLENLESFAFTALGIAS